MSKKELKKLLLSRKPKPLEWKDDGRYRIYAAGVNSFFEIRRRVEVGKVVGHWLWINGDPWGKKSDDIQDVYSFCEALNAKDYEDIVDAILKLTEEK